MLTKGRGESNFRDQMNLNGTPRNNVGNHTTWFCYHEATFVILFTFQPKMQENGLIIESNLGKHVGSPI